MQNKNLPQIATTWKFLMNLQDKESEEKVLGLVGILIKKTLLITEKMFTHLSKTNKIHQQSMMVSFFLYNSVR